MSLQLNVYKDYDSMSTAMARLIASQVITKPDAVLGLATGSTPIGAYQELIRMHREENLDFSKVSCINLDEYQGLAPEHEASYAYFMFENLFKGINVKAENRFIPYGLAEDPAEHCAEYDRIIAEKGIDMQLLGIGHNGHIAFNEPSEGFEPDTHIAHLTDMTIKANSRFFDKVEDVPSTAFTIGMRSILSANILILSASGEAKADAIAKSLEGPITPHVPGSVVRLHSDVRVFLDEGAASKLKNRAALQFFS